MGRSLRGRSLSNGCCHLHPQRQVKGAERVLYGYNHIRPEDEMLIIVEGEMDKLSLNEVGYWNVVSVPDGANLPKARTPRGGASLASASGLGSGASAGSRSSPGFGGGAEDGDADTGGGGGSRRDLLGDVLFPSVELMKGKFKIILATDNDKPGRELAEELARRLGKDRCWFVQWPGKKVRAAGRGQQGLAIWVCTPCCALHKQACMLHLVSYCPCVLS